MKDKRALETLQPLLQSKRLFEAEYAQAAIATIQGIPYPRSTPDKKLRQGDVWLLPADTGLVAQVTLVPGGPVDVKDLQSQVPVLMFENNDPDQGHLLIDQGIRGITERTGNIRIDAVTFGLNEDPDTGAVFILRGQYDPKLLLSAWRSAELPVRQVNGMDVVEIAHAVQLIIGDGTRAVLIVGRQVNPKAVENMVAALQAGKGDLEKNAELTASIRGLDTASPLWAAVKMNDKYRFDPKLLGPFEALTLTANRQGGGLSFHISGQGKNADAVAAAVGFLNKTTRRWLKDMEQLVAAAPEANRDKLTQDLQPATDFFRSLKCEGNQGQATLAGEIKGSPFRLIEAFRPASSINLDMEEEDDMVVP